MKFLFVSFFHPEAERVGATMRSLSIIRALRYLGHDVTIIGLVNAGTPVAGGRARSTPRGLRRVVGALGLNARGLPSTGCEQLPGGWGREVEQTVDSVQPDVVVVDMLWVWPAVAGHVKGKPIVYLEHNVEAGVAARFAAQERSRFKKLVRQWDGFITRRLEETVWAQARVIWAVSEAERLVRDVRSQGKTSVIRNSLPADRVPAPVSRTIRFDALFVGAVSFLPNRLGLEWFCSQVWREGRLGEAGWRLGVLGGTGEPLAATRLTGVEWLGHVEDLLPIYHATRAVVAPIFIGGGTKLKVLEALQFGLPVVAAPHAVEGLDAGHAIRIARTADEWVRTLSDLRSSATAAESRQNREFYLRHHDWRSIALALEASLRLL